MKTNETLRMGLAAIAAATALSSTLAVGQTATEATTGPIVLPESSLPATDPARVPEPTIVVPEVAPVAVADVSPGPVPEGGTPRTTRASTTSRAEQSLRSASPSPRGSSEASVDPVVAASGVGPQEVAALRSAAQSPAQGTDALAARAELTPPPEIETQREDVTEGLAQLLAGLLVAAVAAGGLALLVRRRRAAVQSDEAPLIQRPIVREPVDLVTPHPVAAAQPLAAQSTPGTGSGLPNGGAAIALPREAPTDFKERTSLLRRMVAARPDPAKPFRSPGARLKRARLILASLGRKFESGPPRIDLSDYTSNWPALARYSRTARA